MTEANTDLSVSGIERDIVSRLEYVDYLKQLMVNQQGSFNAKSFVEYSGRHSSAPVDGHDLYRMTLDQVELLMLIESQTDRISQSLQLRHALGSLRGAALKGAP